MEEWSGSGYTYTKVLDLLSLLLVHDPKKPDHAMTRFDCQLHSTSLLLGVHWSIHMDCDARQCPKLEIATMIKCRSTRGTRTSSPSSNRTSLIANSLAWQDVFPTLAASAIYRMLAYTRLAVSDVATYFYSAANCGAPSQLRQLFNGNKHGQNGN